EEFAARRIAFLAVCEFPRQTAGIHSGLAARQFAGLAGGFAGTRGVNALADDASGHGGVLVEPFAELLVGQLLDITLDIAVELALRLAFELRLWKRTLTTATRPSRTSSPVMLTSSFCSLSMPAPEAKLLMLRVSAERKPERCVPPSTVLIVFAKEKTFSP